MTQDGEISTFFELLSAGKWWVLGICLVAALVAGAIAVPGAALYEASVPVRVQFPANLARGPAPDRFATMVKSSATVAEAAQESRVSGRLPIIRNTLVAAVSPADPKVVNVSVQLPSAAASRTFLTALVAKARQKAMATVQGETAGLRRARANNAGLARQIAGIAKQGGKLAESLRDSDTSSAGERLMAEVGLLQMSISAYQSKATLAKANSDIESELEGLNSAVVLDGPITVDRVPPVRRISGYALRGLIVGLVVAVMAVYLPPVRRRLTA